MDQFVEILKSKDVHFPRLLLTNYHSLNITDTELIVLIYLINSDDLIYNPKKISLELNIKMSNVLELINNLIEKGIINLDIVKINNISNEVINLDLLYEKLVFTVIKKDDIKTVNKSESLIDIFESELGRGLTPMELDIINGWKEIEYTDEIIVLALKEATYNGVYNFRYIDRILYEWHKKGIRTKEDVERNKREFKKAKESNTELFDYDWLNDK